MNQEPGNQSKEKKVTYYDKLRNIMSKSPANTAASDN